MCRFSLYQVLELHQQYADSITAVLSADRGALMVDPGLKWSRRLVAGERRIGMVPTGAAALLTDWIPVPVKPVEGIRDLFVNNPQSVYADKGDSALTIEDAGFDSLWLAWSYPEHLEAAPAGGGRDWIPH